MVALRRYYKPIISLFFIYILLIVVIVEASPNKERIYDFADLLDSQEKIKLEDLAADYSQKRNSDFIVLTIADSQGKDIVAYVEDFYDEKALGYDKAHGNTAILAIDISSRDMYLAGFYEAERYLDDKRLDKIWDKISLDMTQGNYYTAFYKFLEIGNKYMGIRPGVNPDNIIFNLYFQIIVSLGMAGAIVTTLAYNSTGKSGIYSGTYEDYNSSKIISRRDTYIRSSLTRMKKPSNKSKPGGNISGRVGGGVTKGGHSHSGKKG